MDDLISSLRTAVTAAPSDHVLRLHLAEQLVAAGRGTEAVEHAAAVLQQDPASEPARELMRRALTGDAPAAEVPTSSAASTEEEQDGTGDEDFDWHSAEQDLDAPVAPMFVETDLAGSGVSAYDVERTRLTLADVGGMTEVKKRLEAAFLAPMRNEELRRMYRKSLRGGLLLYGPPGTGKTFLARALAGELQAGFMSVGLHDLLDLYWGETEKNIHELFQTARANAPVVLFLDEVDAIGRKRSASAHDGHRGLVNQLLLELDSVGDDNDGVFVLAATNTPWDVDPALRRPGRFDRTLLVLPPDRDAREAIWRTHLRDRPVAGVDLHRLAKLTEGYTGADIAHLCESAAEVALMAAAESGELRMIEQADIESVLAQVRPSVGPWFESARNVAMFANEDGSYDELLAHLRKHRRLR